MSKTVWTKIVKEGFTSNKDNTKTTGNGNTCSGNAKSDTVEFVSSPVADFGNNFYIGKSIDELILQTDHTKITKNTESEAEETEQSSFDELNDLYNNFDPTKAKNIYKNGIRKIKNIIDNIKHDIAGFVAGNFYDNLESPGAKNDIAILSSQVSTWFAVIPMSYLMVINWWYVMAYTNYVIDFRTFVWNLPIITWAMKPPLYAFELLNYYTLTFRMDVNSIYPEMSRNLWNNYRPIVFSLFHFCLLGTMLAFPVTDAIASSMLTGNGIITVATIASIYYFGNLLYTEKWFSDPLFYSNPFGPFGMFAGFVIAFIFMFVFIGIIGLLFSMHIMFLSYFVIFAFNGFWPPHVISVCNQIFQELKEMPVDNPIDKWGKLKNAALQNFHSIYLLFIMSIILIGHIYKALSFTSESLIVIAILANLLICFLFAPSAFTVPFELLNIFLDDSETEGATKNAEPGEAPIGTK